MLESALSERVISESPHQRTGNAYQTIRLGESTRGGFRSPRPNLFSGFELEGRSVCDLGANLGEISRDIRRAGASHVDAYEYDHFFTQIARYVTAYNGLYDINHIQADVATEGFMRREYDICVGLAAYSYMQRNIDYICGQVSDLMIIETHEVRDEAWHGRYVGRIAPHFPHWCCFGRVVHGKPGSQKHRLWLAFSKEDLTRFYGRRANSVLPDGEGIVQVDLARSTLKFFDGAGLAAERDEDPLSKPRQRLYSEKLAEHERRFSAGETVNVALSGEAYWLALLLGIAEFFSSGDVKDDNTYLRWMTRGLESGTVDPGLRHFLDDEPKLRRKASLRLSALGHALRERDTSHFLGVPVAYNATPYHPNFDSFNFKRLAVSDSAEELCVPTLDGHHRLFVMMLLGLERCPILTIWDPARLARPKSLARVKNYEQRMYQYLAGVSVDEPVVAAPQAA